VTAPYLPRTLLLYGHRDGPAYWRILAPALELVRRGYPVNAYHMQDSRSHPEAAVYDVVVMTRLGWKPEDWLGGITWIRGMQALGKTIIYETDDDVFSPAWLQQARIVKPERMDVLHLQDAEYRVKALRLCDGAITTTPRLAMLLADYTDAPVVVVPNAIDWTGWRACCAQGTRPFPDGVLIGWAGGLRDDADLAPMAEAWRRIAARFPEARFAVVGYLAPCLLAAVPRDRLAAADWLPLDLYPLGWHGWDVACCPLADTGFNVHKSPIKAFEAAAAGAAVVASPPVYGRVLEPGRDGLLATTPDEWEDALARLVQDAGLRQRLARRWAGRVEREFSLQASWSRWPAAWMAIRNAARARRLAAG
jgi:glycosyltransferase involved in cell wall biosynthesis